eukprot:403367071
MSQLNLKPSLKIPITLRETFQKKKKQSQAIKDMIKQIRDMELKIKEAKKRNILLQDKNNHKQQEIYQDRKRMKLLKEKPQSLIEEFSKNHLSRSQLSKIYSSRQQFKHSITEVQDSNPLSYVPKINEKSFLRLDSSMLNLNSPYQQTPQTLNINSSKSIVNNHRQNKFLFSQDSHVQIIPNIHINDINLPIEDKFRQTIRIAQMYEYYYTERMRSEADKAKQRKFEVLVNKESDEMVIDIIKEDNLELKKVIACYQQIYAQLSEVMKNRDKQDTEFITNKNIMQNQKQNEQINEKRKRFKGLIKYELNTKFYRQTKVKQIYKFNRHT